MRPDVAQAFDRMAAADRSDAEQAVLFARHPDPRWVAPPGESLHRNATELDLGPRSAYGWLAANARRFHFVQRYSWEPWHYGYVLNPRSSPRGSRVAAASAEAADGASAGGVPQFVPTRFEPAINRAAQRWSVSATLLAAQLFAESGFKPFGHLSAPAAAPPDARRSPPRWRPGAA